MAAWMMLLKGFLDMDRASFFLGVGAIVATLAIGTCSTNGRIADLNTHIGARIGAVNLNVSQLGGRIQGLDDRVREVEIAVEVLVQARGGGSPTVNQPSND